MKVHSSKQIMRILQRLTANVVQGDTSLESRLGYNEGIFKAIEIVSASECETIQKFIVELKESPDEQDERHKRICEKRPSGPESVKGTDGD